MIQREISHQQGFSAVELLITLFIGALFLISGIQIYGFIFSNGTESGQSAKASNLAYELLQEYKSTAGGEVCTTDPVPDPSISDNHGLSIVSATIVVECPYSASGTAGLKVISKVTVTVTFKAGSATKSVKQAAYVS